MVNDLIKRSVLTLSLLTPWQLSMAELPAETLPKIETLSAQYPDSVVFAHDANFNALIAGRVVVLDVGSKKRNYWGSMDASQFASFVQSKEREELYVAETHYSRGTRGDRTDVVTIYDRQNLKVIGEIDLPGGKRGQVVSHRYSFQLLDNDRYLAVFNFTPAASVQIIDLDSRKILNDIQIPGCGLVYPTGKRGFSSLCSNGALYTTQFDPQGQITEQAKVPPFFKVGDDPLFDKPVYHEGVAYFPTFLGMIQPVDLSSNKPKVKDAWPLLTKKEKKQNWRPGGWQIATVDDAGLAYMLMHKDGFDGSHKSGGTEVWVYDLKKQKRVNKINLKNGGISIEVTRGKNPYLVVSNFEFQIDVYGAENGDWIRMIGGAAAMPFSLHSMRK